MPSGMTPVARSSLHHHRRDDGADRGADRHHADQARGLRGAVAQRAPRPRPARCSAGCRRRPRTAWSWPARSGPACRTTAARCSARSRAPAASGPGTIGCSGGVGARDAQVEQRGDHVQRTTIAAIAASGGVSMPVSMQRQVEAEQHGATLGPDQLAAEQHAQDDRADGQALDPAVGLDQLRRRQQLGEDAVLGRRVGRGAEARRSHRTAAGGVPNSIIRQPTTLMLLETNITWPLGRASAKAPTKGASTT